MLSDVLGMKLGKQPATHDDRDLTLAAYTKKKLPVPPATFGHYPAVTAWGMLGNDTHGDCVWAGAAHETMVWNAAHGVSATFDDAHVLADYSAVTGFDPSDPNTDQGTNVRTALNYRRQVGIQDSTGGRHKIGAYLALAPGDMIELLRSAYLFGAVGIGIEFPQSAHDQFNAGQPWTVVSGSPVEGGHYVPVVGADLHYVYVVTWGRVQRVTKGFLRKYCDEAFALLSVEYLSHGLSPEGFDLAQLQADLKSLCKGDQL